MTERTPLAAAQRLITQPLRTIRRLTRQLERRIRYRRLGWV